MMCAPMSTTESRRIRTLEAQVLRQAAEIGQLREEVHRLNHEKAVACSERDEARAEAMALRAELSAANAERSAPRAELDLVRRQHADTKRELADLVGALARSDERLRALLRREFGSSSERLCADTTYIPEVLAALREAEETVVLTPAAAQDGEGTVLVASAQGSSPATSQEAGAGGGPAASTGRGRGRRRRPAQAGGRKPLPEDIERRHRTYEPPADHPALRNALGYDRIGTTTIERWHVGKLDLHIEVIECPVVQLQLQGDIRTQQTLSPPAVIERGQVSDILLVQSAVDRVVDHLPAYRQEQRALRLGVHIPRAKLCRWHIALAMFLQVVADAVFDEILECPVIGIDDSVHRRLVDDRPVCQQARIWAVSGDAGTFYLYTPTREGRWITELLEDYRGPVMGDGYAGHHTLLAREDIVALFCWAHARRKFHECADTQRRAIMLALIAELYAIEDDIGASPPQQRVFVRCARAKPVLERIRIQLDAWANDPQVLPKSGIGRAVAYTRKLWPGLERYPTIGASPIDNNCAERALRPQVVGRKNSYFSGAAWSADLHADLTTVFYTLELNGFNVRTWLTDYLAQCAILGGKPPPDISGFLPWNAQPRDRKRWTQPLPPAPSPPTPEHQYRGSG
jgi:transposase